MKFAFLTLACLVIYLFVMAYASTAEVMSSGDAGFIANAFRENMISTLMTVGPFAVVIVFAQSILRL